MELRKLIDTSHDRFLQNLSDFPTLDDLNGTGRLSKSHIRQEPIAVLHTNKNAMLHGRHVNGTSMAR